MYSSDKFNISLPNKRRRINHIRYVDNNIPNNEAPVSNITNVLTKLLNPQSNEYKKSEDKVYREYNHIYFRDSVTNSSVNKLLKLIEEYNREQDGLNCDFPTMIMFPKPLYLHIYSLGGNLHAGLMAYDYIKNSRIPIYTVAEGYGVSAGSIMYMAGKKRFMTESSYILIHQLSVYTEGYKTYTSLQDDSLNNENLMAKINKIYLTNLRYGYDKVPKENILTKEIIEEQLKHDIYWNYSVCFKYGLCEGLYTNYHDADTRDVAEFFERKKYMIPQPIIKSYSLEELVPSADIKDLIRAQINENKQHKKLLDAFDKAVIASKLASISAANEIKIKEEPEDDEVDEEDKEEETKTIVTRSKSKGKGNVIEIE